MLHTVDFNEGPNTTISMCTQMSKDEGLCQFFLKMNFVVLVLTCFCHLRRIVKTELPAVTTPFTIPNRR